VLQWIESAPTPAVLFLSLLFGAALGAIVAGVPAVSIDYTDEEGQLNSLNAVEGDGLERAIALCHSSNPLGKEGGVGPEGAQGVKNMAVTVGSNLCK
jgi:hypothetical protein